MGVNISAYSRNGLDPALLSAHIRKVSSLTSKGSSTVTAALSNNSP